MAENIEKLLFMHSHKLHIRRTHDFLEAPGKVELHEQCTDLEL